jgi:hypothetical protein
MLWLGLGVAAVLGVGLVVLLLGMDQKPTDQDILDRFTRVRGFTITERHAHEGTGLAADETTHRLLIAGAGRKELALVSGRDLTLWSYAPQDKVFRLAISTRRHAQPFHVTFRKAGTADLWLKILKNIKEEV